MHRKSNATDTDPTWYKTAWQYTADVPWAQWTAEDVNFLCKCAAVTRPVNVLDLACGNGRHSLEFAQRGHKVVGVDLEESLLAAGRAEANRLGLAVDFLHADVRDVNFDSQFEVVINLWEGAIGYLENDDENDRHFDVIARALVPGGHHIAGPLYNADWVERSAPAQVWCMSESMALLSRLEWSSEHRQIIDTCSEFRRQQDARWTMKVRGPVRYRVYSPAEISRSLARTNLRVIGFYSEPARTPGVDERSMEYWVHSIKMPGERSR
jgi:SAM-dependent methyltransferase